MRTHADPQVQALARQIFARAVANRQKVIEDYASALTLNGDAARGKKTYVALCSSCHRLGGQGFELGPDLATVKNGGKEKLLTSILEANLALQSVKQNEVVRKISAWAAIIAVPTFIASVYGMNFEDMPELDSPLGYPLALVAMLLLVLALHRYFRRAGWL